MKNVTWIVDSAEEQTVAIEQDGSRTFEVPRFLLPEGVREGDVCSVVVQTGTLKGSSVITVTIDQDATSAAKSRSAAQVTEVKNPRDPGGPIKL